MLISPQDNNNEGRGDLDLAMKEWCPCGFYDKGQIQWITEGEPYRVPGTAKSGWSPRDIVNKTNHQRENKATVLLLPKQKHSFTINGGVFI